MASSTWTCSVCGVRAPDLANLVSPSEILQPCAAGYECLRTGWLELPELPLLTSEAQFRLDHDLQLFGLLTELSVMPVDRPSLKTPSNVAVLLDAIDEWATAMDLPIFKYRHWPVAREFELAYPGR